MLKLSYPLNLPFTVSQKWNENPSYYNSIGLKGHNGWDFAVPIGTPVYATHDGIIQFAGIDSVMSLTISIDTLDGNYRTLNCHMSESKVAPGQMVKCGELIGLSGNTGRFTSGPHLHYGVRKLNPVDMENGYNGAVDPAPFFDGSYPSSYITEPEHFKRFQSALENFQRVEGLAVYPLVGPNTKKKLNKYLTIKYT